VLERTREMGILKAMGAGRVEILGLILGEAVVMAIIGVVVGLVSTGLAYGILRQTKPALSVLITLEWILRSVALALAGSVAGAVYPALRAASADPVEALAYE